MEALKITSPLYLGQIGPLIDRFNKKIQIPGITYESLYAYLAQNVQFGGDRAEFWIVYEGDNPGENPVAFADWFIKGLPHIGKVCCDFLYSSNRKREPVELLITEFEKFGLKHRAPLYEAYAINEELFRVHRLAATRKGYNITRLKTVNFLGRKNEDLH